jgi:hypothetical protein
MRDDQLTRLLRSVDEPSSPDSVFADQLFEQLVRQAAHSRGRRTILLLVAALMLVMAMAVGVGVGSGLLKLPELVRNATPAPTVLAISTEEATPSAAATATVQATPSAAPTGSAEPTPIVPVPDGILPPGSTATVLVDGLRVRKEPSTTASVVDTLAKGDTVTVTHNIQVPLPVIVDGISWYGIESKTPPLALAGWVAAADSGTAFLALDEPSTCEDLPPESITLQQLIDAGSWHRLACLGDTPVTVTGVYVTSCEGGAGPAPFEPAWLTIDWCAAQVLTPEEGAKNFPNSALSTVTAPSLGGLTENPGTIARVTGHFDDTASATCVIDPNQSDSSQTVPRSAIVLLCREQFVVTKIEVLGSMTLPPPG